MYHHHQQQPPNTPVTPFNPYSSQYSQYATTTIPTAATTPFPYFPPYPHSHPIKPSTPPAERPASSPDLVSSITPAVASSSLKRLICHEFNEVGFDAAEAPAIHRIELEVIAFIEHLFKTSHEYANLANRAGPVASDLVLACNDCKLSSKSLHTVRKRSMKKKRRKTRKGIEVPRLVPPPSCPPSPELLPSDDEDVLQVIPITLRGIGNYFPTLPPKHTYLRTPPSPPKKAALPSLEKKLKTAALVQKSLGNLLSNTEDSTNQEDEKLLGHIVNWEMGIHPRKRWKVG